jgi:hypothetical protein
MTRTRSMVLMSQPAPFAQSVPLLPTPKGSSRKSVHTDDEELMLGERDDEAMKVEHVQIRKGHTHSLAYWVAPPSNLPGPAADLAGPGFGEDGCGGSDGFAPYTFFGPRDSPPFRLLHHIIRTDVDDLSTWAENMRWAAEQRATSGGAAEGWVERPEYINRIAQTRAAQQWVSQKWLESQVTSLARGSADMGDVEA